MMPLANSKVVDTQRAYRLIHFDHATPADEFAGRDVQIVISEDELAIREPARWSS